MSLIKLHSIGRSYLLKKKNFRAKLIKKLMYYLHNSYLPLECEIGKDTLVAYGGIGIVVHDRAKIGSHCMIGQGITIGGRNGNYDVPTIEDNVYIGAGARILGAITIGHDSIIGPNAVITKDIPPYSVVVGVPAKIINTITKENFEKYINSHHGPLNYKEENR